MKKAYDYLNKVLPYLWGWVWVGIITMASLAVLIWVGRWLLTLMGVL